MWEEILKLWKADNLLDQAWKTSHEMVKITHEMFLESIKALREEEHEEVDKEIRAKDKKSTNTNVKFAVRCSPIWLFRVQKMFRQAWC